MPLLLLPVSAGLTEGFDVGLGLVSLGWYRGVAGAFGLAGRSLRVIVRGWLPGFFVVARDVGACVYGCERDPGDGLAGGADRVDVSERGVGADRAGADWRDEGPGEGDEARGAGDDALGAGDDALGAGDDARGAGDDALGAGDDALGAGEDLEPEDPPDLVPPPRWAIAGTANRRRAAIATRDRANMEPQRRCGRLAPATRIPEAVAFMLLRTRRLRASQRCVDGAMAWIVSPPRHLGVRAHRGGGQSNRSPEQGLRSRTEVTEEIASRGALRRVGGMIPRPSNPSVAAVAAEARTSTRTPRSPVEALVPVDGVATWCA